MNELLTLPTVAGLEHELATIAFDTSGTRIDSRVEHDRLIDIARRKHPFLSGRRGIYLGNSLNVYEDASNGGAHLEVATAECSSPAELAAHSEAANRIVQDLVEVSMQTDRGVKSAALYRHSADYMNGVSWATHLSVLSTVSMKMLVPHITAHLVSKIVYAGSGGFVVDTAQPTFCLAPRVNTFTCVDSGVQTERDRGLVGGDKEHHCPRGLSRLHFLCHENLCSPLARYLDVGSAMLIVRMLNAGLVPGITLTSPMKALRAFATDPFCREKTAVNGGERLTAVQIQRRYLDSAEEHITEPYMPAWAAEFCAIWRRTLAQIEEAAPWSVSDRLDWAAKHVLLSRHADAHHHGSWSACSEQLMEIDMRFGQARTGLFDQLRASGLMDGDVPGVGTAEIERAKKEAPQETRARFRGEWIQRLHEAGTPGHVSWTWVEDEKNNMLLDLHDPWGRNAEWRRSEEPNLEAAEAEIPVAFPVRIRSPFNRQTFTVAQMQYENGEFEAALELLSGLIGRIGSLDEDEARRCLEYHAWAAARLGKDEAFESLVMLEATAGSRTQRLLACRLFVMRMMELRPLSDEITHLISEADEFPFDAPTDRDPVLLTDLAACMNQLGRAAEAETLLNEVLMNTSVEGRNHARAIVEMGETLRLLDQCVLAHRTLMNADASQQNRPADLADFNHLYLAKLVGGDEGRGLLAKSIAFQSAAHTPVAEVRSQLIDARLQGPGGGTEQLARIRQLRTEHSVLQRDRTLDKILAHWHAWSGGGSDPEESGDPYWRL